MKTVFILRDDYGTIMRVSETYEAAIEFVCRTFFDLDTDIIRKIIEVFIQGGYERFEAIWAEFRKEPLYIEEFEVEN